eukprot:4321804-Karenia_brevis.AAC.1
MLSFNAAIAACENDKEERHVAPLLNEMKQSARTLSFGATISACEKCEQWLHVGPLLNEMPQSAG